MGENKGKQEVKQMATFKVYYNAYIDQESHPEITTKQSAVLIAKTLTTNEVGGFDWDEDAKGLNFCEYVYADVDCEEDLAENPDVMPQIKDADYGGASRLRKPRK